MCSFLKLVFRGQGIETRREDRVRTERTEDGADRPKGENICQSGKGQRAKARGKEGDKDRNREIAGSSLLLGLVWFSFFFCS